MEKIHEFVGSLLDQKGITDIDDETRQHLIEDMTEMLMGQIDRAAIEALPEEKAIELANGLDDGSIKQEDVPKFMVDAGVNLEEVSMITMLRFRDLYLGIAIAEEEGAETDGGIESGSSVGAEPTTEIANAGSY